MAEPIKTPLEPGLIARVAQGIRYIVTGASDAWMGPNQPTPPQADSPTDQTKGRAFDYRAGVNLDLRPKTPEGGIDFTILRGLADAYDLVRLCIETRKDQICAQDWTFKIKGNDKAIDPRLDELVAFFQTPDKVNKIKQEYQDRLEKLQSEVKKLKTAQKEHAKLLKNQSQYQQQMDKLRTEVLVRKLDSFINNFFLIPISITLLILLLLVIAKSWGAYLRLADV